MLIVKVLVWQGENIYSYIHAGGKIGVLVDVNSTNQELVKNIAMHIAAYSPIYITQNSIPENDKNREIEILKEKTLNKPENIAQQIIQGGLKKWYKEVCLLEQEWLLDEKKSVKQILENTEIKRFYRLKVGK